MADPTLVKITAYDPDLLGDIGTVFTGRARFQPTITRHIEGETPPDYLVTRRVFFAEFGAALLAADGVTILQPATPGVAWAQLEPTDVGPYADQWAWNVQIIRASCKTPDFTGCYFVPEDEDTIDFGDLVPVDCDSLAALPGPQQAWYIALEAAVEELQDQIDAITAGDVESVNTLTGDVVITLVENPPASFFYELDVSN